SSWVPNPEGTVKSTRFSHFAGLMNHRASVIVPAGLDGGIIDTFLGTDVHLVSGANHRVGSPSPYDRQPGTGNPIPQVQEAEFSTNGFGNTKFAIDISNVDQWSLPVRLSLQSSAQTFGTTLTQARLFHQFNTGLTGAFQGIIFRNDNGKDYVANPRKFLDAG